MNKYVLTSKNINEIRNILNSYKCVSFDVFDTLIYRTVSNSKEVFKIIEHKYSIKNFYIKRVLAEKIANKIYSCPNINQIYNCILLSKKNKENIINLEIKTELSVLKVNKVIQEIYNYCIANDKYIIINSDMYFNESILRTILANNKYKNYSKVYVSCDINKSKYKGDIFPFILKDLSIKSKDIIHIGDNKISDINNAKNIDTIWVSNEWRM